MLSQLASFMQSPTEAAMKGLRRVMLYIASNISLCVEGYICEGSTWEYYVDSDHAGDRNVGTRSQTGYIAFYNGIPVDWCSKKQCVTSIGSAEAEIYALSEGVKRARMLQWSAEEMGLDVQWPMCFKVDNKACISFQRSTNPDTRLLGVFDLREQWVRELRDMSVVVTQKVVTALNVSDLLTKCHVRQKFVDLVSLISGKTLAFY